MGLDERKAVMQRIAFASNRHITSGPPKSQYDSIDSMERSQKVEALKNDKLDPTMIKNPYDKLAHAFHLWKTIAARAKANPNISFTEERKIAENFYDGMLAPTYANDLKIAPMEKELWMKQAYGEALNYNIDDAYGNDWLSSLRHGWNSGLASVARAADRVTTVLGNSVDDAVALWKYQKNVLALPEDQQRAQFNKGWHEHLAMLHNVIATTKHDDHTALADMIHRGSVWQDQHRQFWADAIPARDGFLNGATNFVAEQVALAPVYSGMMLGGEALGAAGGSTLTARLSATPAGRRAMGYLLAGGEGLAYGAATEKQTDPGEKYRDAIGFAVFHGLFDVGGLGLKKLIDILPSDSKKFELAKRKQDELMLREYGEKTVDPVKKYEMHKNETANNIAAVGIPGQVAIHADALSHLAETENMGMQEVRDYESKLLKEDPARWSPVLSAARYIRKLIPSGVKVSTLEAGSKEAQAVKEGLQKLILDSASEMNTHVKDMGDISEKDAVRNLKRPSAKHTLEFYVNKVQKDLAKDPGAAALLTKEHVQKAAEKMYAEDLQKAAEYAEKEAKGSKVEKAVNIGKRIKTPPAMKIRSERVQSGKNVSVRYQIEPDYKVRFAEHKRAAAKSGKSLKDYFAELDDEDFVKDMNDYFYPKSLKNAKIFFEKQATREGMQNPNFLAFMHNYSGTMPKEFADELRNRLIDTVKVQKYMSGRKPTGPQIDYYAKAMHNHVDNFLGSGRWPNEHNLFRSSNESVFKTTNWQRELLIEKTVQEQHNLKEAFSGEPKALKSALAIHSAFAKLRLDEFDKASVDRNSQEIIKSYDDLIADLQTKTKQFKRWKF